MTRHRRRVLTFVCFCTMGASSSSALSLANFQVVTSNQVGSSCLRAYQDTIEGCTRSDFTDGNQCTLNCATGLQKTQTRVQRACNEEDVNPKSLLGLTLSGDLVEALCPNFQATTVTVQPSMTQQVSSTVLLPAPPATSSTIATTEVSTATTEQPTTNPPQNTSPPVQTSDSSTSETSRATSASPSAPAATQDPSSDDGQDQDQGNTGFQGFQGSSGSGSPFDPAPIPSSATLARWQGRTATFVELYCAIFWLVYA
ncbi:hypothetical protein F4778DRAFT_300619 [Xylariomycetidae sp. FL2044]|nr:hypothetical protein F4778DRAFT_300619 [Xylariomycetidae sp. FL2044]